VELTPKQQADAEEAQRLVSLSLAQARPLHLRAALRTVDAFLRGPLPAAYDEAMNKGDLDLAKAYVVAAMEVLSMHSKGRKIQSGRIETLLLSALTDGPTFASALRRELEEPN